MLNFNYSFFPNFLLEVLFFPDDNDVETILMFVLAGYDQDLMEWGQATWKILNISFVYSTAFFTFDDTE